MTINDKLSLTELDNRSVVLQEARELIKHMARDMRVWSWGAHQWALVGEKIIRFKVQANHFKGYVFLTVDGSDTFQIYLVNQKGFIKDILENVYVDELIERIDNRIERIDGYGF